MCAHPRKIAANLVAGVLTQSLAATESGTELRLTRARRDAITPGGGGLKQARRLRDLGWSASIAESAAGPRREVDGLMRTHAAIGDRPNPC